MAKSKKKFYVVWEGRKKGIFDNWKDCKKEVEKYFNAKFMGFPTRSEAEIAFSDGYQKYWGLRKKIKKEFSEEQLRKFGQPIIESISVDGAWDTSTGIAEYQGVSTKDKKLIFHKGPFEDGTNNLVEFLALVHALSYCKKHKIDLPIYSDSKIAIGWVKKIYLGTNKDRNEKNKPIFELVDRAMKWLNENEYSNKILKWETKAWGENPADFGRK
jgi:ribonuclease HI